MVTSDIIQDVRDQLDQPTSTYLTDAMILRWINEAQRIIARKTRCIQDSTTLTTVASQAAYTLDDVVQVEAIYWDDTGDKLQELSWASVNLHGLGDTTDTGTPEFWGRWNDGSTGKVYLFPTPSGDGDTLTVYYCRLPAALTNAALEEPEIPEDAQAALTVYAQYKYKWMEGEYPEANHILAVWDDMVRWFKYDTYTEGSEAQSINVEY